MEGTVDVGGIWTQNSKTEEILLSNLAAVLSTLSVEFLLYTRMLHIFCVVFEKFSTYSFLEVNLNLYPKRKTNLKYFMYSYLTYAAVAAIISLSTVFNKINSNRKTMW